MRSYSVELGSLQLDLAISFGVAKEIGEKVADPMLIAQEAATSAHMARMGIVHKSRFEFSVQNIPMIIWIGAKLGNPALKLSEVQEACCEIGFMPAMTIADRYLVQFIAPRSQENVDTDKDAKPGE